MARLTSLTAFATAALASTILPRQSSSNTATVNFANNTGNPEHLAAGFIYGLTGGDCKLQSPCIVEGVTRLTPWLLSPGMNRNQIPNSFYEGMGFNYARVGGAQMTQGGWVTGLAGYKARFQNAHSDYTLSRRFNASVVLLPHDLWGADHANYSSYWPGDNGNWTNYDQFLNTL